MADLPHRKCNIANNFYDHQIIFDITYDICPLELELTYTDFAAIGLVQIIPIQDVLGHVRIISQIILGIIGTLTSELLA